MHRFGYADKSGREGRINFGGIYAVGRDFHGDTGLALTVSGYDEKSGKIEELDGALSLPRCLQLWYFETSQN